VTLLQSAYAALTLTGLIVISLVVAGRLNIPSVALLVVIILFFMAYAIPPLHLADKGYGEILLAIYLGTWLPSFSFLLEYGQFHRLLTFTTFPLTLMAVAYFLVIDFPTYVSDQKLGRFSLLSRLSWQRAIPIHHLLLLAAFVLFTAGPFFGIPWALVWPALLVLPFAVVQIIWLQRISLGGPTFWNFLTTLALATFGLTAYLLAFTFWTR
jgi:1,4-dihydroxy-2-naphthoate octaprenyltransferase